MDGHTSYILDWLKTRHFYSIHGQAAKFIGGEPITDDLKERALRPMQKWIKLVQICVEAEFPDFSVVMSFSAFDLPKVRHPKPPPSDSLEKLNRLAERFHKPDLIPQFKDHWRFACGKKKIKN